MPSHAGAIDLSALKNKPATPAPAVSLDDLTPEEQETLDALADAIPGDPEPEPKEVVETAFIVYQKEDGSWEAHADLGLATKLDVIRAPHPDDFLGAAATLTKDITSMETAQQTLMLMQMQAQAIARQQQQQQAVAQANNLRGLRV